MTAFVLSAAVAFALYQLLAFAGVPRTSSREFSIGGLDISPSPGAARVVATIVRIAIVLAILVAILYVHDWPSPLDAITANKINIVFGFLFGPLLAIWVNSVAVHNPTKDLTRGHIVAAIGLVLLFLIGAVGDETAKLIRQYANHLKSAKFGGVELTFGDQKRAGSDRLGSTSIAGHPATFQGGGSSGLAYLSLLAAMINRDESYLKLLFSPKDFDAKRIDLSAAKSFTEQGITTSMTCLGSWLENTADATLVNKHLALYVDTFRQLETLSRQQKESYWEQRLLDISKTFTRNSMMMARDIVASTALPDVLKACQGLLNRYCPPAQDNTKLPIQCLDENLRLFTDISDQQTSNPAMAWARQLADHLRSFIDERGLELRPYFAIGYASLMAQLGHYPAAASILQDWLDAHDDPENQKTDPNPQFVRDWFDVRARSILAAYVEEWLKKEGNSAAEVIQTEHINNLDFLRGTLKARMKDADFFRDPDQQCAAGCPIKFTRPVNFCSSSSPDNKLELWQTLYTSYVSMEATYLSRTLQHPKYPGKFARTTNAAVQRAIGLDLSCGTASPPREIMYAQILEAFASNAVSYSAVRAKFESAESRNKRFDDGTHAAQFGLEIIDETVKKDSQRAGKRFLERIEPSLAMEVQERLVGVLADIERAKRDTNE